MRWICPTKTRKSFSRAMPRRSSSSNWLEV
jgi:hypothetical protein